MRPFPKIAFLYSFWYYTFAITIFNNNQDKVSLSKATVKIVKSCYLDRQSVIIPRNTNEDLINAFTSLSTISTILNSNISNIRVSADHHRARPLFLTTANSTSELQRLLHIFKLSDWWDIEITFFILDTARDCKNAENILRVLWRFSIVTGFFGCHVNTDGIEIYTYNPYTNYAPSDWTEVSQTEKYANDWTMYRRKMFQGKYSCETLKFDRTKFLGSAPVRVLVPRPTPLDLSGVVLYNKTEKITRYRGDTLDILQRILKAPLDVKLIVDTHSLKESRFSNKLIINGEFDVSLENIEFKKYSQFMVSHPAWYPKIVIITPRLGFYTPLEKICRFYGLTTLISLAILLSVTFIVVAISDNKMRRSFAAFEILRLLINTGLHTKINRHSGRIFFFSVFVYFMVIHATFQGRISGFLTKDIERENVETLDDLKNPRYKTIYTVETMLFHVTEPEILKKVTVLKNPLHCLKYIVKNASVACLMYSDHAIEKARAFNLHFTTRNMGCLPFAVPIKKNWPLHAHFNKGIMIMEAIGISLHWDRKLKIIVENHYKTVAAKSVVHIRKISLNMISFAFTLLVCGLLFATVVFFRERLDGRKRLANSNVKVIRSRRI